MLFRGDIVVLATEEGRRIAETMGTKRAAVLLNHGLLTVGSSVDAAAYRFIAMERCCQVQLLAEAAGPMEPLSEEDARATRAQLGSDYVAWLGFQGFISNSCATARICANSPEHRTSGTDVLSSPQARFEGCRASRRQPSR